MEGRTSESSRALARRLGVAVYLPWALAQFGLGILLPTVPLYLRETGLSYTAVSVVVAAMGLGAVVGGLPAGSIAGRWGPEVLFVAAAVASGVTAALLGVTDAVLALAAFRFVYGVGGTGKRVAAQMLVNRAVPAALRGRAMSMLGGASRLAFFLGPLAGGALVEVAGFGMAFATAGAATLLGLVPFLSHHPTAEAAMERDEDRIGMWKSVVEHRGLLALAGVGAAAVVTVRAGRSIVVPLIGDELQMGPTAVGALVAVGTGADLVLFPVAGWLMDRYGRLFSIVPAFSLLGIGMLVLGSTSTVTGAVVAGVIMGIGNGLSAGTMLTLGADLAPPDAGPFLAALGTLQAGGAVVGPIVVGWLADATTLGTSAVVLGAVMFVAIAWIVVVLGDTARPSRPWLVARLAATRAEPVRRLDPRTLDP